MDVQTRATLYANPCGDIKKLFINNIVKHRQKNVHNIFILFYIQFACRYCILTVNSPVRGSNPTCTVCSKFSGGDITGLSASLIFVILLPEMYIIQTQ